MKASGGLREYPIRHPAGASSTMGIMLDWAAKYQPQRDRYWLEAELFFNRLPPQLHRQSVLLKNNLATFYSDTGQFKDILRRPHDPPFLYLHFWLLDDLGFPDTAARALLEKHLFLAMTFAFAALYTREIILDEGSNFDHRYLFLEHALAQQANLHLAQIHPPPALFWDYAQAFWYEYTEALLAELQPRPQAQPTPPEPTAAKLAFAKLPIAAVGLKANQEAATIAQLCAMLDQLNGVLQTLRDIAAIRMDINRRRYSYPIMAAMQAAGIDPNQLVRPEQILGALVLTDIIGKIGQESLARLDAGRKIAKTLNLPSFTAYFGGVETRIEQMVALFSIKARPEPHHPRHKPTGPFFTPYVETIPKVIEMAESYLLADLTFRESWEVQRRGLFGVSEMTAKAFPAGLIIEILCQHGHRMAAPIDMVFQTLQTTGFRYYDHDHLPPDTDDLGLLLRLYPYSAQPETHRKILQQPLGWLMQNISQTGQIPVWLTQQDPAWAQNYPFTALWGRSCATVEANLLLGLIAYDWPGYRELVERSAEGLLERLQNRGLSASQHYIPLYTLWTILKLMAKLSAKSVQAGLQEKFILINPILVEYFAIEAKQHRLSPQDAAFLSLICLSENAPPALKSCFTPTWISILCKHQRYDGSWLGEALFGTPTRGELAAWYASSSVTTAYCYHALKLYQLSVIREQGGGVAQ